MRIFLSGYYGYANAGDEAVLAAILEHFSGLLQSRGGSSGRSSGAEFTVTAGDPSLTSRWHSSPSYSLATIPRQSPRDLLAQIRACDLFVSGGGSLLQDVTSVRNVVYYTGLIRMAALSRKPVMIYAQGVGPLAKPLSRKLARAAIQRASAITVRDQASADLLQLIGVTKPIEVTADPVWGLSVGEESVPRADEWTVSLRSWPGDPERGFGPALAEVARQKGAKLRLLPMQPDHDEPVCLKYLQSHCDLSLDQVVPSRGLPPREMVALASRGSLMIAMRLHALIFAASRGVPCIAVDYDPKVKALSQIIGAPCLDSLDDADALRAAIASARALSPEQRARLATKARSNAERALELVR